MLASWQAHLGHPSPEPRDGELASLTLAILGALSESDNSSRDSHFPPVESIVQRLVKKERLLLPVPMHTACSATQALSTYLGWLSSDCAVMNGTTEASAVPAVEYTSVGSVWAATVYGERRGGVPDDR